MAFPAIVCGAAVACMAVLWATLPHALCTYSLLLGGAVGMALGWHLALANSGSTSQSGKDKAKTFDPQGDAKRERILQKTVVALNGKLSTEDKRGLADAFTTLQWSFKEQPGTRLFLVMDGSVPLIAYTSEISGNPDISITMDSFDTLRRSAYGKTSFGIAFTMGKLKVQGLPPLKLTKFVPLLSPFLAAFRESDATADQNAAEEKEEQKTELRAFTMKDAEGCMEALRDKTIAVVGYGQLGKSMAYCLREGTAELGSKIIVGQREDDDKQQAIADGYETYGMAEACGRADIVYMLVPDEVQPAVMAECGPAFKPGSAIALASGYNVAYGLMHVPDGVDLLLFAPRMIGETVRSRFDRNIGFVAYVNAEVDATGEAWKRVLALAAATRSLKTGCLQLTCKQEADLDLFGEQCLGPFLGAAILSAYKVGVEAGLPPEGCLLEMYLSGEMSETFKGMAKYGFFRSVGLHGYAASFGGMTRTVGIDRDGMEDMMRDACRAIIRGDYATALQAEEAKDRAAGALMDEMVSGANPINLIEDSVKRRINLRFD